MAENFPNMGKETVSQVQEVQKVTGRINPRRNMLRHVATKQEKKKKNYRKEKILKAIREKLTNNIQGNSHKVIIRFSSRNFVGQKGLA